MGQLGHAPDRFLSTSVRGLRRLGVRVATVMTDNGAGYRSRRFRATCQRLGLRHLFTRPYTPRTNGKVERFIKTALLEWAYARLYRHSELFTSGRFRTASRAEFERPRKLDSQGLRSLPSVVMVVGAGCARVALRGPQGRRCEPAATPSL